MLNNETGKYSVAGYLSYLEDPDSRYTVTDIIVPELKQQFIDAGDTIPNFGVTLSAYWFHFRVANSSPSDRIWWLELQDPLVDRVDIYYVRDGEVLEQNTLGDHFPMREREVQVRNPVVIMDMKAQETIDVYLRIKTYGSTSAPAVIWQPEAYPPSALNLQFEYGIYYGIIVALFLYNLMLFLSVRDLNYLYYCSFVGWFGLWQLCYNGLSYEYLWPDYGQLNLPAAVLSSNFFTISILQFARSFLRGRSSFPKISKAMLGLMLIGIVPLLIFYFIDKSAGLQVNALFSLVSIMLVLCGGLVALHKGVREARYFMVAWGVLLAGIIVFNLTLSGFVTANFVTVHAQQLGSALCAILLSFALAHRLRVLMEENERIQIQATENLERRVQERTSELDSAMKDLAAAHDKLKENSFNDGLTGVRNRTYFNEQFEREWYRCRREKQSIALLLLDIDHFKSINDTYGHLCGDHALRTLAGSVAKTVNRPGDIVARYGGEEFVVVLPNTNIDGARFLAERIRRELEKQSIEFNEQQFTLTVSVGCASCIPGELEMDPEGLIDAADKALYSAKQKGRNKVCAAG